MSESSFSHAEAHQMSDDFAVHTVVDPLCDQIVGINRSAHGAEITVNPDMLYDSDEAVSVMVAFIHNPNYLPPTTRQQELAAGYLAYVITAGGSNDAERVDDYANLRILVGAPEVPQRASQEMKTGAYL